MNTRTVHECQPWVVYSPKYSQCCYHPQNMSDIFSFFNEILWLAKPKLCHESVEKLPLLYLPFYSICKYMQILQTHHICGVSAQKKMSTLLYFGLYCLPYFLLHQPGMLKQAQSLAQTCLLHISLSLPASIMLFFGPHLNTERRALAIQTHSKIWSVICSLSTGSRSHFTHVF